MGKGRRAKAWAPASAPKRPKATPQADSSQGETPLFCFRYANRSTSQVWAFKPTEANAPELLDFICEMARLTWAEIERQETGGRDRHRKHHDQPVESIETAAQADVNRARLTERFGGDIFRFRLGGEKRLWGFRANRVFHVVFWDPDHNVYEREPN